MSKTLFSRTVKAALGLGLGLAMGTSVAADYPVKPISLTVAYGPGGATDFQARIATMTAAEALGQPVVIVNRAGAGGRVGWNWAVERGGKDGYDLIAYNLPHKIAQWTADATVRYNADNIIPLANWGSDPAVLFVSRNSPFNTVDDLVRFARDNPGRVTVSGAGLHTGHHIAVLQLERAADIKLNFLPAEQGGVQALQFVIGGQVQAGFNNLSDVWRNQDQLRVLAIAASERDADFLPEVATFRELGLDIDDTSTNLRGIAAVKGTPPVVLDFLAERLPTAFNHPTVLSRLKDTGSPALVLGREDTAAVFAERTRVIEDLLRDLGQ
ncbi:tripartite tricarboxylate transporter substrate binding protein [Ectothiorhodospira lacustris]|uniref:tripartite tricarboxylate transporter substrate binding protein n=1 Tax=Ectothiorhodospira lacustris TaxID=2899127 RepID=UPI001EE87B37|nr:tripartite tricarboxylate transporter substrate binding protein [Ectothiorhodospira lacustris]MCG5501330.1 tripartite tricarboxylate transporter substrate binding protein [Ectothiorhodospira lacustris]